jgi:lycopene beta-cyclase
MGCAGLSLALHMIQSGKFSDKKVLLLDKEPKNRNDRTWCFWETTPGIFEDIVYRKWNSAWIYNTDFSRLLELSPYQYKLIRGLDFYNYCLNLIQQQSNFEVRFENVTSIVATEEAAKIETVNGQYTARYIFNSILFKKPVIAKGEYFLLQHFKGWVIKTVNDSFDPAQPVLMDFRTGQARGTSFFYVMPFSKNEALVEYTLFSKEVLSSPQYDNGIREYVTSILKLEQYSIVSEEIGSIPMTNHRFIRADRSVINIGTAGGQTKPTSGYTFSFIQRHSKSLVNLLAQNKYPLSPSPSPRYNFYDSTLLHILANEKVAGNKIFTTLFKKNKPQQVLRFLDNQSSITDELKIISSLPTFPFLKAAIMH